MPNTFIRLTYSGPPSRALDTPQPIAFVQERDMRFVNDAYIGFPPVERARRHFLRRGQREFRPARTITGFIIQNERGYVLRTGTADRPTVVRSGEAVAFGPGHVRLEITD